MPVFVLVSFVWTCPSSLFHALPKRQFMGKHAVQVGSTNALQGIEQARRSSENVSFLLHSEKT
jgi:hypothetical protein